MDAKTAQGLAKRGPSLDPSGYDAGKKIKGRKRHILVDTLRLLLNVLNVVVHPAGCKTATVAFRLLRRASVHRTSAKRKIALGGPVLGDCKL